MKKEDKTNIVNNSKTNLEYINRLWQHKQNGRNYHNVFERITSKTECLIIVLGVTKLTKIEAIRMEARAPRYGNRKEQNLKGFYY